MPVKKRHTFWIIVLAIVLNLGPGAYPYLVGKAGWFSQIEDHHSLGIKGLNSSRIEWLNTEDPDITYLGNGLQQWITGTHEFVYHPGTPVTLIVSAIAGAFYRADGRQDAKKEFALDILRRPYLYAIANRLVSALFFAALLTAVYLFVASAPGSGKYGPSVAVLIISSAYLFRQYSLKVSGEMYSLVLHILAFAVLARPSWRPCPKAVLIGLILGVSLIFKLSNILVAAVVFGAFVLWPEDRKIKERPGATALFLWVCVFLTLFMVAATHTAARGAFFSATAAAAAILLLALFLRLRERATAIAGLFTPAPPLLLLTLGSVSVLLFSLAGLFSNENFVNYYMNFLNPSGDGDIVQRFLTDLHYDRLSLLAWMFMTEPFLIALLVLSLLAGGGAPWRMRGALSAYLLVYLLSAVVLRPNYHYLLPSVVAAAVIVGTNLDGLSKRRYAAPVAAALLISAVGWGLFHSIRSARERLEYIRLTRVDRETFEGSAWGTNRYFFGFSTSLFDRDPSGLQAVGHYGFYPYEVMLKRFASIPVSLPNFYAVEKSGDAEAVKRVVWQCFEKNMIILSEEVYGRLKNEALASMSPPCEVFMEERNGYAVVRSGPLKSARTTPIETGRGWKVIRSGIDHLEIRWSEDSLELRMQHRPGRMRSEGRWIEEFPAVEKKLDTPVPVGLNTYFRWTQADRSKSLIITLTFKAPDGSETPLSYALNAIPEWRDRKGFNFVDLGNEWPLHDSGSEYTFQRGLMADIHRAAAVPRGPLHVTAIRVSHLSYTKTDHYRRDRDHGGYVKDMAFIQAVGNDG